MTAVHADEMTQLVDDAAAVAGLVGSDPERAVSLCTHLAARADMLDATELAAAIRYQWARALVNRGEPAKALLLIDQSRVGYLRAGNLLAGLRTDLGRMHVLDDLGAHVEAVTIGERTCRDLAGLSVDGADLELATWIRAAANENLGVAHGFLGNHRRALAAYQTAEESYSHLEMSSDLARVRANRGVELIEAGHAADGLALLAASARQFLDEGDLHWYAKCRGHEADAHTLLGNYRVALGLLEEARQHLDDLGAVAEATRLTATLANVSLALSLPDEAYSLAVNAERVFQSAGMVHDAAVCLARSGEACIRTDRVEEAMHRLREAERLFDDVGATQRSAETSLTRARALDLCGDRAAALELATTAVARLGAMDSPARFAVGLMVLADVSDAVAAGVHLTRAAAIIRDLALPPLIFPLHLRLGRAHRRRGEHVESLAHLTRAVSTLEQLRSTVPDELLRAMFLEDKREAVEELADAMLSLPDPDIAAALAVCERGRTSVLVELGEADRGPNAEPQASGSADLDHDRRELTAIYNRLLAHGGTADSERHHALRSRAAELESEVTLRRLRLSGLGSRLTTIEHDHNVESPGLDPRTIVIYETFGSRIDAFVWSDRRLHHRRLHASLSAVLNRVRELEQQWAYFRLGPDFEQRNSSAMLATTQATLQALHNQLIAPLDDFIGCTAADSEVTFVASGELHQIPFHALHDGKTSLHERSTVTFAPSAGRARTVNRRSPSSPSAWRALILGIADESIPFAAQEAEVVANMFGNAKLFVGSEASTDHLVEHAAGADLIHLACHGLHRADNPAFSSIQLADRWISAAELAALPLQGATVVLSSCESGRHGGRGGEPVGLSWALLAAGAAAVVVSLWSVHDTTTAELMSRFYRRLIEGADHAAALRGAQLDIARRRPHPYYWAPFVLMGPFPTH